MEVGWKEVDVQIVVKQASSYNLEVASTPEASGYITIIEVRKEGEDTFEGEAISVTYAALPGLIAALEAFNR